MPPQMAPTDSPAPPSMMSPYGMPLSDGGPEGPYGPGPFGPGSGSGAPDRRRKTLIASALAVVAVVGIGGAVAYMSDRPSKHDSTALAGNGSSASGTSNAAGAGLAVNGSSGGKPDGDSIAAGPSSNGAQSSAGSTSGNAGNGPTSGPNGQNSNPGNGVTSSAGGHPVSSNAPGQPVTSAPGGPAPSQVPSAPKPSAPGTTTAKPPAAAPPSSDCTYLDLPAAQMPVIKQGSTNINAVKELQCLLKKSELGIKPLAIDGSWGADTQSAMTAFQSCNNSPTVKTPGGTPPYPKLAVDGVAGPQTWADLYFWDNQYFNGTSYYCNGTR